MFSIPERYEMSRDEFWRLIDWSRTNTNGCDGQVELLTERLASFEPDEILSFDHHCTTLRYLAYRHDLWAVAYIMNGGCSDDGFDYFRGWLITQGKELFEAMLQSPENAALAIIAVPEEGLECEGILSVAWDAYERKMGQTMPPSRKPCPQIEGMEWQEEDLEKLYPRLWSRFLKR
jgi:hypothetical protein